MWALDDLATNGARPRRQHDARRTFISLCLTGGGRSDMLCWITHARPKTSAFNDYVTLV